MRYFHGWWGHHGGPVFRLLDDSQMLEIFPRLQVLTRSSLEDKKILVEKLRALGDIVGVTGVGTNDGPVLKTAHVDIVGTEVAKDASDIIFMDNNFSSIVVTHIGGCEWDISLALGLFDCIVVL
jgi:Ca2+-transporting ATPase